jgi:glycerol-1-phosphate dehydrogenase [NAD(P)+]
MPLERLDVDKLCSAWPGEDAWPERAKSLLGEGDLATAAGKELRAKHSSPAQFRTQIETLRTIWPDLKQRLKAQLLPLGELKEMLHKVGAPTEPEHIGITRARLRDSYWQAFCIRRRFTILDVAVRIGVLDEALKTIFGPRGIWPAQKQDSAVPAGAH